MSILYLEKGYVRCCCYCFFYYYAYNNIYNRYISVSVDGNTKDCFLPFLVVIRFVGWMFSWHCCSQTFKQESIVFALQTNSAIFYLQVSGTC